MRLFESESPSSPLSSVAVARYLYNIYPTQKLCLQLIQICCFELILSSKTLYYSSLSVRSLHSPAVILPQTLSQARTTNLPFLSPSHIHSSPCPHTHTHTHTLGRLYITTTFIALQTHTSLLVSSAFALHTYSFFFALAASASCSGFTAVLLVQRRYLSLFASLSLNSNLSSSGRMMLSAPFLRWMSTKSCRRYRK